MIMAKSSQLLVYLLLLFPCLIVGARQPNFLIMMADDMSYTDIGCYGSPNAHTPHLDKLASQGMRFEHCYNAIAMCSPTRNMLYSGLYPVSCGSHRNHTHSHPGTKSIVHYLGDLGYRVGITGKFHVAPPASFPFERIKGFTEGCVNENDDYNLKGISRFMQRDATQPFCLVVSGVSPHIPWTVGDPSRYPPASLKLPPHWLDTPETRQAYSKYLAEVTYFDQQVGDVLACLDKLDLTDNTLFLFLSEQGAQFPGAKWTCWEQGIHAGAIARWPGKIKPGTVSPALIEYVDVVPTFIEAAGGAVPPVLEGQSFLKVLTGETTEGKAYAYGIHNNCPEGPAAPVRSIRNKHFSYILNLIPNTKNEVKWIQWVDHGDYWFSWEKQATAGNEKAKEAIYRYERRPAEELYDLEKDPWEMNNLAQDPALAETKAQLRSELLNWMRDQGDTGIILDVMPPRQKPLSPPRLGEKNPLGF